MSHMLCIAYKTHSVVVVVCGDETAGVDSVHPASDGLLFVKC